MNAQEIIDGLLALGFDNGYVVGGEPAKIILWENQEPQPTEKEIAAAVTQGTLTREHEEVEQYRLAQYQVTSDPLFFGWQRGDNTEQEWLDAVQAVKDANPYPTPPNI